MHIRAHAGELGVCRTVAPRFWNYAPLVMALGLRLASEPTANLSYLLVAVYALCGPAFAIRALALSWLFTTLGQGIAPDASAATVGRYAVLFAAALSALIYGMLLSKNRRSQPFTLATVLLGLFLMSHSLLFSPFADVSVLKALAWTLAMAASVSAWTQLSPGERQHVESELFWGLALILLTSLPMSILPIGYLVNGTGFQGILIHPQTFGPTIALLGAWAAARMFSEHSPSWWLVGLVGLCVIAVMMSESRAAGLAMIGGVGLAILLAPGFAMQSIRQMAPGLRSGRIRIVLVAALIGGIALAPWIAESLGSYLTKSGRASGSSLAELYDGSRGLLVEAMLENITEHPMTGIGFGVASIPWVMEISRDPIFDLPTGAAVEKGVAPVMVLEEVGIFGALLVMAWLLLLLRSAARSGLAPFGVCLTVLLLNFGEATLFSPGGFGLLPLVLLGWAYAAGVVERRQRHG